jgi:serine/threonine protein kinase/predicted ATPase/tetratricopeptide (TPR) repeat protein
MPDHFARGESFDTEDLGRVFEAALDLPEDARAAYLDQVCRNRPRLRHRVERLLAADRRPGFLDEAPTAMWSRFLCHPSPGDAREPRARHARTSPGIGAGDVLCQRYRIERLLARGGMGAVYRAIDLDLDVALALKTIRPEIASHPDTLRRFKREVLLARSISHPNVCRIYDLGRDPERGITFLTMEYLPGETLETRIRRDGPLVPRDALPLLDQITDALDAAHQAAVIHRDLKSANIMLVPSEAGERAVLTDFGIACAIVSDTRGTPVDGDRGRSAPGDDERRVPPARLSGSGSVGVRGTGDSAEVTFRNLIGTAAYMAPEQVRGVVSASSDLYALGVVLFEMATGHLPFVESSPLVTAVARLKRLPPTPSEAGSVAPEWDAVILRLLAVDPTERYGSAREAFSALVGSSPHPGRRPGGAGPGSSMDHSLPAERDAFVGREAELSWLSAHLGPSGASGPGAGEIADPSAMTANQCAAETSRLITIVGPGGTGKTRVAVRYGWESRTRWPGGVWFADLSQARARRDITRAVADALKVPFSKDDPVRQLGNVLRSRAPILLILDNFEQVARHAEETLGRWLDASPGVSFLVTSRERLRLPDEIVYSLEQLDPATHGTELFEIRAQSHRPGFHVDEDNQEDVREIVRLLDGMPLAIELAAARMRMLSLDQLRERLHDRLHVLKQGLRGRHSALDATMEWSWELLEPWEQSAAAQASIFEGGFTLESAEAVLDTAPWPQAPPVVDIVQSLIDKSWLRTLMLPAVSETTTRQGRTAELVRFDMYAIAQEYLRGKLRGETALRNPDEGSSRNAQDRAEPESSAIRRHAAFFASMGAPEEILSVHMRGGALGLQPVPAGVLRLTLLQRELPNLIAACRTALRHGWPSVAANCYVAACAVLYSTGPVRLAIELGEALAAIPELPSKDRTRVVLRLGHFLQRSGDLSRAGAFLDEGLALSRDAGDLSGQGHALHLLALLAHERGATHEAKDLYNAALSACRNLGNRAAEGSILISLGNIESAHGRLTEARILFEEAVALARQIGNGTLLGTALNSLAKWYADMGRFEPGRAAYEEAIRVRSEVGDRYGVAVSHGDLAALYQSHGGRFEDAERHFRESIEIHRAVGSRREEGLVRGNLGALLREQGRRDEAKLLLDEAALIHREYSDLRSKVHD